MADELFALVRRFSLWFSSSSSLHLKEQYDFDPAASLRVDLSRTGSHFMLHLHPRNIDNFNYFRFCLCVSSVSVYCDSSCQCVVNFGDTWYVVDVKRSLWMTEVDRYIDPIPSQDCDNEVNQIREFRCSTRIKWNWIPGNNKDLENRWNLLEIKRLG